MRPAALALLLPIAFAAACTDGAGPGTELDVQPSDALSVGAFHACGISVAGGVVCWGGNPTGQLGNGLVDADTRVGPTPVAGGLQLAKVSAGTWHTCALRDDGVAYCWGLNHRGQLGRGTESANEPVPAPVATALRFTAIGVGRHFTCALDGAGSAYCWGTNTLAELGNGTPAYTPNSHVTVPMPVSGGLRFAQLAVGENHACGLTAQNEAYCWGHNWNGALGGGEPLDSTYAARGANYRSAPTAVTGAHRFRRLAAGDSYTCGITTDDRTLCWGFNAYGALGDGTPMSRTTPAPVAATVPFAEMDAGGSHNCALTRGGTPYCWGLLADTLRRTTPLAIPGGFHFRRVASGAGRSCGVTGDGEVFCWGRELTLVPEAVSGVRVR